MAALDDVYRAIEAGRIGQVAQHLRPDAFVFTPTASGVLTSAADVLSDLAEWTGTRDQSGTARFHVERRVTGASPSGAAAWVFDDLVVESIRERVTSRVPIRVTALLTADPRWRIAAAYWSIPFATQREQDAVKAAGALAPGAPLSEHVGADAIPFADALRLALTDLGSLPGLYSTRGDHVTIGSVVDEVFIGSAGKAAWDAFVPCVRDLGLRGGLRGQLVADGVGWLAANIDIGRPPTPYRFLYFWLREDCGWRIVVSHDAVSRDRRDRASDGASHTAIHGASMARTRHGVV